MLGFTSPTPPLDSKALSLQSLRVELPHYDPRGLRAAVVHFGVGGFHRAHQAVYFHELAEQQLSNDWGVIGVGLHRREMKEVLSDQDHLFTVVERGKDHERARVIGSMVDYRYAPEEPEAIRAALVAESTKLVTLTITGTSYHVDPHTGAFRAEDDEIACDLKHAGQPTTVFGYLVEALGRRRAAGIAPFTVLSCDNVQHNGRTARTAVVSFARHRDPDLAHWIDTQVSFPSSMVDRITPATSTTDRDEIVEQYGLGDRWPVLTEPFSQWIIEDDFCNERPPLDRVGVQFVDDVHPYELMKTRLLNAGHCALGYFGLLLGHASTAEAMADADVRDFLHAMMSEVMPMLPPVPGVDLAGYRDTLLERFANPRIGDQLERLARRGSTKMPSYLLPSLIRAVDERREHRLLTLAVASWFRFLEGTDCHGRAIDVQDAMLDTMRPLAAAGDVRGWLAERAVFGTISENEEFVTELELTVARMRQHGPRHMLQTALETERDKDRQ